VIGRSGNLASIETRLTPQQLRRARLISASATPVIRLLGATYRWRVDGLHHYESIVSSGRQPILAFWHGRILGATLFWRNRGIVVMISENFDGEWIARIIRRFGYETARGSSSRGGVRALLRLKQDVLAGRLVGFAVDGPRGPARVAQPGAVWLAGATGHPVLPFHAEASRFWSARSWDRTQVPKPFSTVAMAIGQPIVVTDTSESAIGAANDALERNLKEIETRAADMLAASAPRSGA
jgi:lysophospholipid acyltransferase (LPLAT)-like uncharacterized protein